MLKLMRKSTTTRNVVIIVVVLALASYVLVSFGEAPPKAQGDTVARLGSSKIKVMDVRVEKRRLPNIARGMPPEQIDQLVVGQLLNSAVLLDAARKADVEVSSEELRDLVIKYRSAEDGSYRNDSEWAEIVRYNYGLQVESFEQYLRENDLTTSKYSNLFLDGLYLSEDEISKEFLKANQKVDLEMVVVNTFDVKSEVDMTDDAKLKAFYESHKDQFLSGPLRQIRYVELSPSAYKAGTGVSDEEVEKFYNEQREQRYKRQERVKARHVLIKTDTRTEAEALKKIQEIEAKIKAGLDFTEAAKQFSEEPGADTRGGDLGFFGRGRMVPEFDAAVFAMAVDTISEPVKTQFGYHLIKKDAHETEGYRSLEEVKASIQNELSNNQAKDKVKALLQELRAKVIAGAEFETEAAAKGYQVDFSLFFDEDRQSFLDEKLRQNFQIRRVAFELKEIGDLSDPVEVGQNVYLVQWIAQEDPKPLDFEVEKARIKITAEELAAEEFIENIFSVMRAEAAKDPSKALKAIGERWPVLKENHFRETGLVSADNMPWELRQMEMDFTKDIYSREVGEFVAKVKAKGQNRLALCRVKNKEEADMEKFAEERIGIADQLRRQVGNQLLSDMVYARLKEYDPNDQVRQKVVTAVTDNR